MCFGKAQKAGAVILLSTMFLVACGGGEDRQAKYLERANNFIEQDNSEKAKVEIKNVLQINPNNAEARYLLGLIAESDQDFRAAFGNFNAAIAAEPDHVKSLNKLAAYYALSKDEVGAQEKIDEVLAIDPNNADAIALQAGIFFNQGKTEDAIEKALFALSIEPGHAQATGILTGIYGEDNPELALEFIEKAIAAQSKNEAMKMLKVRVLSAQDKRDEVISLYKQLIADYPDSSLYTMQLVKFHLEDDRREEPARIDLAERVLRDQLLTKPEDEQLNTLLVQFLVKYRGVEQGIQALEALIKEFPENLAFRGSLATLYLSSQPDDLDTAKVKAKALFEEVINADPTSSVSIEARNRLVKFALIEEDMDTARSLLAETLELAPENPDALIISARFKMADKNVEGAITDLRVVLKGNPESSEALSLLAAAYVQNNAADLALDSYQRLLAVEPKNLGGLVGIARVLTSKGEFEGALRALESAQQVDANNVQVLQQLVDLYDREKRWDDALAAAAKLTEQEQTAIKALGYYLQGRTHLRKEDLKAAVPVLEKSYANLPGGIESMGALVGAYVALEQQDKAMSLVSAHVEKYPEQLHAQEMLGNLYANQGEMEQSRAVLEKVVKQAPGRISAYRSLTRVLAAQGKTDEIETLYLNGLKENPDNAALRLMLAEFYQATSKIEHAVSVYEELLKSSPDALGIKNNLASLLMDYFPTPDNINRAAELADGLAATENPAFLDTAGWAYYQQGNYPQAVSLLGAAVEGGGNAAVFHYHLGMAYFKSGLKQQAKEQLEMALSDDKAEFVGKEEAASTLKQL